MKRLLMGLALLAGTLTAPAADNTPTADITNRCDSTIYKGARITSRDDCKVEVTYQGGIVSVWISCLPEALQKQLRYDPKKCRDLTPPPSAARADAGELLRKLQEFERDFVVVKSGSVTQFAPKGVIVDETFYLEGNFHQAWNFTKGSGVSCRAYRDFSFEWKTLGGIPYSFPRFVQVPWGEPPK